MLAVSDESDTDVGIGVDCNESSAEIAISDDSSQYLTSDGSDSVTDALKHCGPGAAGTGVDTAVSHTPFEFDPLRGELAKLRADFVSWDRERQNVHICELIKHMPKHHIVLFGQTLSGRKQFCDMVGLSTKRFDRIKHHVDNGGVGPPPDGRHTSAREYANSEHVKAHAYFEWLYTNVAESLAEGRVTDEEDTTGPGAIHESMFRYDDVHIDVQAMPELRGIAELQPRYAH
eukprot:3162920-Pyramimonas_sp.AAC.1